MISEPHHIQREEENSILMRALFLAAAAMITVGLAASLTSSQVGKSSSSLSGRIVDVARLAFTPRGCFGSGTTSPIYWIMWATIYALNTISAGYLLIRGLFESHDGSDRDDDLLNGASFVGAAFFLTSVWASVFNKAYRDERQLAGWALWFAACIIAVAAILVVVGIALYRPGLNASRDIGIFVGVPWDIFAGWLIAAGSIGFNLAFANENHTEHRKQEDKEPSIEPVIGALIAAIAAGVLGSPLLALPMLVACFFVKVTWASAVAAVVALLGIVAGGVRTVIG